MTFFATSAFWNCPMSTQNHTVVHNLLVDVSDKEEEEQQQQQ